MMTDPSLKHEEVVTETELMAWFCVYTNVQYQQTKHADVSKQ